MRFRVCTWEGIWERQVFEGSHGFVFQLIIKNLVLVEIILHGRLMPNNFWDDNLQRTPLEVRRCDWEKPPEELDR